MKITNMPGFTAPSALYTNGGRYHTSASRTSAFESVVVPQLPNTGGTALSSCTGRCRAVTAACFLACTLLGPTPGAALCVAACTKAGSDCTDDCKDGVGGGITLAVDRREWRWSRVTTRRRASVTGTVASGLTLKLQSASMQNRERQTSDRRSALVPQLVSTS